MFKNLFKREMHPIEVAIQAMEAGRPKIFVDDDASMEAARAWDEAHSQLILEREAATEFGQMERTSALTIVLLGFTVGLTGSIIEARLIADLLNNSATWLLIMAFILSYLSVQAVRELKSVSNECARQGVQLPRLRRKLNYFTGLGVFVVGSVLGVVFGPLVQLIESAEIMYSVLMMLVVAAFFVGWLVFYRKC